MKLRVDVAAEKGTVRGKVWKKGEPEPADWTISPTKTRRGPGGRARDLRRLGDGHRLGQPHGEGERMTRKPLAISRSLLALRRRGRAAMPRRRAARPIRARHVRHHLRPQHGLRREGPARQLGRQDRQEREVVGRRGLADLRRAGGGGRQGLRGHEQRGAAQSEAQGRPGRRHGLRRRRRRVPLADDPRQAALGPRQRLAAAGRLLDPLRRGQAPLLHLEPGHDRLPRHRGPPGRQERGRHRPRRTRARPTAT